MKRISVHLLAAVLVFALFTIENPAQTKFGAGAAGSLPVSKKADIHGYFFIKGKAPQGFADIDNLVLGGDGEYGARANPPFYGQIRLKNKAGTDYKLRKPIMSGKNFSFKTESVRGVSYEFEGAFSRLDFTEPEKQPVGDKWNETVLSGTLKKMKAGKMIAQSKVSFRWELGD